MTLLRGYVWSRAMVDADERMPRLLGEAAKRYREESGVVVSQIAGPIAADAGTVKRFEGGSGKAPGSRTGVEELLDVYAAVCDLEDRWDVYLRAIRIARGEESARSSEQAPDVALAAAQDAGGRLQTTTDEAQPAPAPRQTSRQGRKPRPA